MLGVAGGERHADAPRLGAHGFQAQPAGRQLVTVGRLNIPVPEMLAQSKPDREIEDDVGVGPGRAGRRRDRLAELHQRLGLGADLEAKAQRLPLEAGGDRQHNVGELGCRVHEQIGVNVEIQRRECSPPAEGVGKCEQQFEPNPTNPRIG